MIFLLYITLSFFNVHAEFQNEIIQNNVVIEQEQESTPKNSEPVKQSEKGEELMTVLILISMVVLSIVITIISVELAELLKVREASSLRNAIMFFSCLFLFLSIITFFVSLICISLWFLMISVSSLLIEIDEKRIEKLIEEM